MSTMYMIIGSYLTIMGIPRSWCPIFRTARRGKIRGAELRRICADWYNLCVDCLSVCLSILTCLNLS